MSLEEAGLQPARDHVCLLTTSGSRCVSPCVQWALGHWRWGRRPRPETRAVLVIHEWGIPHPDSAAIAQACRERGWALIEDCAHALVTALWAGEVGRYGDWSIYSLPKFTSIPSGGLLRGPSRHRATWPATWRRELSRLVEGIEPDAIARRDAWSRYADVASGLGALPAVPLPSSAVPWKLPLRSRGIHALTGALQDRGHDAEACVHTWSTLVPCNPDGPNADELRDLLTMALPVATELPPIRRVEGHAPYHESRRAYVAAALPPIRCLEDRTWYADEASRTADPTTGFDFDRPQLARTHHDDRPIGRRPSPHSRRDAEKRAGSR